MMRRNSTSRRVHALSSGSIRSDEIAATDMALSRDWSRAELSDIRLYLGIGAHVGVLGPERGAHRRSLGPPGRQNQLLLRQIRGAVTLPIQDARTRSSLNHP